MQSNRNKHDNSAFQKSKKDLHKNLHSSSLPATPRTEEDRKIGPEQLLNDLKFKTKKEKHKKGILKQNFAQTSPALAAILKSLRPSTSKYDCQPQQKSFRSNCNSGEPNKYLV